MLIENLEVYGIIYKITNKVNGKMYIGLTTQTILKRWKQHIQHSFNKNIYGYKYYFHRAMRKYGVENFVIEQIDVAYSEKELKDKEIYYINKFNTYCKNEQSNGYNLTKGGDDGGHRFTPIIQLSLKGKFIKEWEGIIKASESLDLENSNIGSCCLGKRSKCGNYIWMYKDDYEKGLRKTFIENRGRYLIKEVIQLDLNGNYLAEFETITLASTELNIDTTEISRCCKSKNSRVDEFMFIYKKDWDKGIRKVEYISQEKQIVQLDKKGNFIKEFKSISEASRELNILVSGICVCLKNKKFSSGGFMWEYKDEWDKGIRKKYTFVKNANRGKPIIQLDLQDCFIKKWESTKLASQELNISSSGICHCLKGRKNTLGGYKWMYYEDYMKLQEAI